MACTIYFAVWPVELPMTVFYSFLQKKSEKSQTDGLQVFAESLKTWREKQSLLSTATSCRCDVLVDRELAVLQTFVDATKALITRFYPGFEQTKLRVDKLICQVFLPRDALSAKRGFAVVSRPSVCLSARLSVCDSVVPWAYMLG